MTSGPKATKSKSAAGSGTVLYTGQSGTIPDPRVSWWAHELTGKFVYDTNVYMVAGYVVRVDAGGLAHGLYVDNQGRLLTDRVTATQNTFIYSGCLRRMTGCAALFYKFDKAISTLTRMLAECPNESLLLAAMDKAPERLRLPGRLGTKFIPLQDPSGRS